MGLKIVCNNTVNMYNTWVFLSVSCAVGVDLGWKG